MTVLFREHYHRNFLDVVRSLLVSVGIPAPATLEGATQTVLSAAEYANVAAEIIWNWTSWPWRREPFLIQLLPEGVEVPPTWHALPLDFVEMVTRPLKPYGFLPIEYMDYNDLVASVPGFRSVVPDYETEDLMIEREDADHYRGAPQIYTIYNGFLGLYPAPSTDFVESVETLVAHYIPAYRRMIGDGDPIPVAPALLPAHHFLAMGLYKQTYEHNDAMADQARGYELIRQAVTRKSLYAPQQHDSLPRD